MKSPFTGENEAGVDLVLIQSFQRYFVNYVSYVNQHFLSKISIRKGTKFSAEFPTLLFWPENARSRRIFPASCFRLIFSRFLKLFLDKERECFLRLTSFLERFFATFLWFLGIFRAWACDNFGRGNALDCLDLRSFRGAHSWHALWFPVQASKYCYHKMW